MKQVFARDFYVFRTAMVFFALFLSSPAPEAFAQETFEESLAVRDYVERVLLEEEGWKELFIPQPLDVQKELTELWLKELFFQPLFQEENQILLDAVRDHFQSEQEVRDAEDPRLILLFGPKIREILLRKIPQEIQSHFEGREVEKDGFKSQQLLEDYEVFLWTQEGKKSHFFLGDGERLNPKERSTIATQEALRGLDALIFEVHRPRPMTPSEIVDRSIGVSTSRLHYIVKTSLALKEEHGGEYLEPFLIPNRDEAFRILGEGEVFQDLVDRTFRIKQVLEALEKMYGFRGLSPRTPELQRAVFEAFVETVSAKVPQQLLRSTARQLLGASPETQMDRYVGQVLNRLDREGALDRLGAEEKAKEGARAVLDQLFHDVELYIDPEARMIFSSRSYFMSLKNVFTSNGALMRSYPVLEDLFLANTREKLDQGVERFEQRLQEIRVDLDQGERNVGHSELLDSLEAAFSQFGSPNFSEVRVRILDALFLNFFFPDQRRAPSSKSHLQDRLVDWVISEVFEQGHGGEAVREKAFEGLRLALLSGHLQDRHLQRLETLSFLEERGWLSLKKLASRVRTGVPRNFSQTTGRRYSQGRFRPRDAREFLDPKAEKIKIEARGFHRRVRPGRH